MGIAALLNPDQFDDRVAYEDSISFSALGDEERVAELLSTLQPYIIRRQKMDVESRSRRSLTTCCGLE
jgi:hypothetical protein